MGRLNIRQLMHVIRKYFLPVLALSLAVGLLTWFVVNRMQTYTCTLDFKYRYEDAALGLAPDGVSKLDPYEIQNPVVIHGALEKMGLQESDEINVKGIRQNIAISKVITDLDREVSESAALLGEKYDVTATEYEVKFTYKAAWGKEFGARMFSNIIKEYDDFLLTKYYDKKVIENFANVVRDSDADYIFVADTISQKLDSIITYLDSMAEYYPEYRSAQTGYTFAELSGLYQNLRDIQYAKYYGNIRAGNLAKDSEMVIKSYRAKVKELTETWNVDNEIAENYKAEIETFYTPYKEAGLYTQAQKVQDAVDSTNTRDFNVIDNFDIQEHLNTYDKIVLDYVENATSAADGKHTISYYNTIVESYLNDTVSEEEKARLLEKNETIFEEILNLSETYSGIANQAIDELYNARVNEDLQYLIAPEVSADKPVKLIAVFLVVLSFGTLMIGAIFFEVGRQFVRDHKEELAQEDKITIDTAGMDELHQLLYQQYLKDFEEFYLVYQPMVGNGEPGVRHGEVFLRWNSAQLGMVSPEKIIDCMSDFGIFKQLNDWIIRQVCMDLDRIRGEEELPIIHINCPTSQIQNFALNDIIIEHISKYEIPAHCICLELNGRDIAASLEDIMLLHEMGVSICIDNFENSNEEQEIINVVQPGYIKMSVDFARVSPHQNEDGKKQGEIAYFLSIVAMLNQCRQNGIKTCVCGVENAEEDRLVTELGFDFKQGYYYGKPERL